MGLVLPAGWGVEVDEFELWPEHQAVVLLFMDLQTQWRLCPMGRCRGFDYAALESVLRLKSVAPDQWAGLFADLQVMERAALAFWSK